MKIVSLSVENFRALAKLNLENLGAAVVVAGPNGCGKSCALDAIRLLKSAYGGYGPNEWEHWFGEFQINLNKSADELSKIFNDPDQALVVRMAVSLSEGERRYIRENLHQILEDLAREELNVGRRGQGRGGLPLVAEARNRNPQVEQRIRERSPPILAALNEHSHVGEVTIQPNGHPVATDSPVLELIFSLYRPHEIGIIDFHGANRNYNREQLGGINLSIDSSEHRQKQHALYNHSNKYQNLKSEMAASYVRHLLAKQANPSLRFDDSLTEVLKELFATFFPGKEFLGPKPTDSGRLEFPVRTPNGAVHDIDDLSSGEKEVLYGYLRLRNSAPRNSVLLIDEPEIHLNPRLVSGLAAFYYKHLGRALGNQIWMVTHSDTLIRESVGQHGFSVFHLQPAGLGEADNQATPVLATDDLERCVIDLVGDMAAYRPGAKLVLCEGEGDVDFDVRMISTLFPEFAQRVNMLSSGNKRRVGDLHELLERARLAGHLPARVYMITDSDGQRSEAELPRRHSWPCYHIENYLLESYFILKVLDEVAATREQLRTEAEVEACLEQCARETVPELVSHELRVRCNAGLVGCLSLGVDPARVDIEEALREAVERSAACVARVVAEDLAVGRLGQWRRELTEESMASFGQGTWRLRLRGRQVLRRFVGHAQVGIGYEVFRDLILARMSDAEVKPIGMARILHAILDD